MRRMREEFSGKQRRGADPEGVVWGRGGTVGIFHNSNPKPASFRGAEDPLLRV